MKTISRALVVGTLVLAACHPAAARITRIVIDETIPMPVPAGKAPPLIAYEQVAGRAFGEMDPKHPANAIIQDIKLAKDADGKVRYIASFVIYKPVDMAKASGMLWHDVPNRGRVFAYAPQEQAFGDIMLASAWQGDNAGQTAVRDKATASGMQFLQVPVAKDVTGKVLGRIVNRSGPNSQPLLVQTNPVPYKPASLDTTKAKLTSRAGETQSGKMESPRAIFPARATTKKSLKSTFSLT